MGNREEGNRPEVNVLQAGTGVEDRVKDQMTALVRPERERAAGKKRHNVDNAVVILLIRRSCRRRRGLRLGGPCRHEHAQSKRNARRPVP